MFYFEGEIPVEQYSAVDKIANSIIHRIEDRNYEKYIASFINQVCDELCIILVQQRINYVFRKR